MKNLLVLLVSIFYSVSTSASPGDDIWIRIKELNAAVASGQSSIQSLQEIMQQQQIQINNIKREKGEKGDKGEIGAPGPQGPKGVPGHYVAGEGVLIDGDIINVVKHTYQIGDPYLGGLVFWVDDSGQHGLVASKMDVNDVGVQWRNGSAGSKITNARGDGIGAGETNTRLIISQQTIDNQKGIFAALLADTFKIMEDGQTPCNTPIAFDSMCYGGWYLPSAFELQLLYKNLHQNNAATFAPEFYWSSTEASVSTAWLINFSTGELSASNKSNTVGRVRAITRF